MRTLENDPEGKWAVVHSKLNKSSPGENNERDRFMVLWLKLQRISAPVDKPSHYFLHSVISSPSHVHSFNLLPYLKVARAHANPSNPTVNLAESKFLLLCFFSDLKLYLSSNVLENYALNTKAKYWWSSWCQWRNKIATIATFWSI